MLRRRGWLQRARQAGSLNEAILAHQQLVARAPQSDWAHYELGHTLLMSGRPSDAIDPLERALDLNRWNISALRGLASAHANLGDFKSAVDKLEQAVTLRPKRAQLWRELAEVRGLAGDSEGAATARAEASRLDG